MSIYYFNKKINDFMKFVKSKNVFQDMVDDLINKYSDSIKNYKQSFIKSFYLLVSNLFKSAYFKLFNK